MLLKAQTLLKPRLKKHVNYSSRWHPSLLRQVYSRITSQATIVSHIPENVIHELGVNNIRRSCITFYFLERQAYGKMKGIVATKPGVQQGIVLFVVFLECRIDGFHSKVEAQDEIVEIET